MMPVANVSSPPGSDLPPFQWSDGGLDQATPFVVLGFLLIIYVMFSMYLRAIRRKRS